MTRKRTGKPRHTVKPLSIAAFEGPEYGLYYLASKSYTGYWPCQLVENEEKDGKLEDAFQVPTIFFLLPSPSQTKYFHFPNIFLSFLLPSDLRPHISLSVLRSNLCLLFLPGLIPNVFLRQIISSFIKRPNDFPQKFPSLFFPVYFWNH